MLIIRFMHFSNWHLRMRIGRNNFQRSLVPFVAQILCSCSPTTFRALSYESFCSFYSYLLDHCRTFANQHWCLIFHLPRFFYAPFRFHMFIWIRIRAPAKWLNVNAGKQTVCEECLSDYFMSSLGKMLCMREASSAVISTTCCQSHSDSKRPSVHGLKNRPGVLSELIGVEHVRALVTHTRTKIPDFSYTLDHEYSAKCECYFIVVYHYTKIIPNS